MREETHVFHFSHKGVAVSALQLQRCGHRKLSTKSRAVSSSSAPKRLAKVSERRQQPKDPLATDYTGDLVIHSALPESMVRVGQFRSGLAHSGGLQQIPLPRRPEVGRVVHAQLSIRHDGFRTYT